MDKIKGLFDLPEELIYNIFDYIPKETLSNLSNIRIFHKFIINHLFPICIITNQQQQQQQQHNNNNNHLSTSTINNSKIFKKLSDFKKFQFKHEYFPRKLIIYEYNQGDELILNQLNYCSLVELHYQGFEYFGGIINNERIFKLVIVDPSSYNSLINHIPEHIKELRISQNLISLINTTTNNDLYKLEIDNIDFDFDIFQGLTKFNIYDLRIIGFINNSKFNLPKNITRLTIVENQESLSIMNLETLPLKVFKYKGNLNINRLSTFTNIKLPKDIDQISLNCINLIDLKGIEKLEDLTILEIIDCPRLLSFFNSKFPDNLKKLIYKFQSIIPNLTFFQNQLINNFQTTDLIFESNEMIFLKIDENFQLPKYLQKFILDNIPYVKIHRLLLLNLPNLNELIIKRIPGFVNNRLNMILPSSLYRLTLNNVMLESIEGVQFPDKLTYLDLARNQLSDISSKLTNLKRLRYLEELNLLRNRFDNFVLKNDIPIGLKNLSLQSNLINQFELNQDLELWKLNLMLIKDVRYYDNEIKFPNKLCHLQMSIQVNQLSDNFQLPNTLQTLLIHHPYYGKIPTTIQFFNMIQYLPLNELTLLNLIFVKDCQIKIPASVEKLTISGNFNQNIINNFNISHCEHLTHCNLTGGIVKHFNLNSLPNQSIYQLELKNMKLKYITGDFNNFKNLKILNLEQNQIISILNLPRSINELILNKNELNDLSNLNFLSIENCHYLSKIYLEMNPNLNSKVVFKIAKLLMNILENFVGIYLSLNLIFSSNLFLENYDIYGKIIVNTDFIN